MVGRVDRHRTNPFALGSSADLAGSDEFVSCGLAPMLHGEYTFVHAAAGGVLIGLASLLAMAATGKIPGISGVFSRLLQFNAGDTAWRAIFLVGLIAGAVLLFATVDTAAVYRPVRSLVGLALAGVLVGFGTRLSGGCTSGHGVCGIGMGSRNGILATVTFMAAGGVTVYVLRALGGVLVP